MHLPNSSAIRLIGGAGLAALAAAAFAAGRAAAASPPVPGPGSAAATPRCATSGLDVWLDTNGNGAAGSSYYNLELTNLSGHTCTLSGYPGVSAVTLADHAVGSAASRDGTVTPHVVKLARGASAIAVLRIVDAGNFTPSACHDVTAAGLRVFPPNQAASKVVPFPFPACARTGPAYLSVRAVQRS